MYLKLFSGIQGYTKKFEDIQTYLKAIARASLLDHFRSFSITFDHLLPQFSAIGDPLRPPRVAFYPILYLTPTWDYLRLVLFTIIFFIIKDE